MLVDEEALAVALRSHHLGGAALDVRRSEPQANVRASEHAVDEVLRVLRGERARTPAPE